MKFIKLLPIVSLVIFFGYRFLSGLESQVLFQDEHDFVYRSRYFDSFFLKHDFSSLIWDNGELRDQPPVSYYLYGLTLHLAGHVSLTQELEKNHFNEENFIKIGGWWILLDGVELFKLPPELIPAAKLILQARLAAVIFSLGCLFLIYLLGIKFGGVITGIFSVLILGFNPLFFLMARRAMADSILLFFLLANILLILYAWDFLNKREDPKFLFSSFLIGANSALAINTKLNGWMTFIIWGITFFPALITKKNLKVLIYGFLISLASFLAIAFSINPYFYSDPIGHLVDMVNHRVLVAHIQQLTFYGEFYGPLVNFSDRLRAVFQQTLLRGGQWNNFKVFGLDLILFLFGIIFLLKKTYVKFFRKTTVSLEMVFFIYALVTFAAVIFYIPLNWDRYYLPLVAVTALIEAYGLFLIFNFVWQKTKKVFL